MTPDGKLATALVLSGGGARGAYEAGVLSYLENELTPELGGPVPIDILCGTSVGALNTCALAAFAHAPEVRARRLVEIWQGLVPDNVLSFGLLDAWRLLREALGRPHDGHAADDRFGGLIDTNALQSLLTRKIPWLQIGRNLRRGRLRALSVAATHVGTGRTVVFVQRSDDGAPFSTNDTGFTAVRARIGVRHALASAAIPLLFPPVRVGGDLYVDGGLRLNVPLSPALRLGADRLIVVSMRPHLPEIDLKGIDSQESDIAAFPSAPYLAGKMLNAVFEESVEQDIDRLERLNAVLEAGASAFGHTFAPTINSALQGHGHLPLRQIRTMLIRPSRDLGTIAAEVMNEGLKHRGGLVGRLLQGLAERESSKSADLVSYLLFDGAFADRLIELGRQDARARRDDWLRFFAEEPQTAWERHHGVGIDGVAR